MLNHKVRLISTAAKKSLCEELASLMAEQSGQWKRRSIPSNGKFRCEASWFNDSKKGFRIRNDMMQYFYFKLPPSRALHLPETVKISFPFQQLAYWTAVQQLHIAQPFKTFLFIRKEFSKFCWHQHRKDRRIVPVTNTHLGP